MLTRDIIGLTGPAGVGKDTVAMLLTTHAKYAFALPLKQALAILGIDEPASRSEKECVIPGRTYSYRRAAQTLGTEWARNLDPDFWLNLAAARTAHWPRTVFTDVRFENEAAWVRSQGGVIWHISGRKTTVSGEAANHASETPVKFVKGDKTLDNSGSFEELWDKVEDLSKV